MGWCLGCFVSSVLPWYNEIRGQQKQDHRDRATLYSIPLRDVLPPISSGCHQRGFLWFPWFKQADDGVAVSRDQRMWHWVVYRWAKNLQRGEILCFFVFTWNNSCTSLKVRLYTSTYLSNMFKRIMSRSLNTVQRQTEKDNRKIYDKNKLYSLYETISRRCTCLCFNKWWFNNI